VKNGQEVDPLRDGHAQELKEYLRGWWSWIVRRAMVSKEWRVNVDLPMQVLRAFIPLNILTWED
jgi:hypothetical protein